MRSTSETRFGPPTLATCLLLGVAFAGPALALEQEVWSGWVPSTGATVFAPWLPPGAYLLAVSGTYKFSQNPSEFADASRSFGWHQGNCFNYQPAGNHDLHIDDTDPWDANHLFSVVLDIPPGQVRKDVAAFAAALLPPDNVVLASTDTECEEDHSYQAYALCYEGCVLRFRIQDDYYPDNSGSLWVGIRAAP